jgi:hypothetical protein
VPLEFSLLSRCPGAGPVAEIDGCVGQVRALEVAGYVFALFPRQRQRNVAGNVASGVTPSSGWRRSRLSTVDSPLSMSLSMNCCRHPAKMATSNNHDGNDSGQQTTELYRARALLISGFGVRVPGGAPASRPMILGPPALRKIAKIDHYPIQIIDTVTFR